MRVITLRNIPPDVAELIEASSERSGLSLNKTVIRLLQESLGVTGAVAPPRRHDDLDELAGTWTEKEALEFDRSLAGQRQIDRELWD